MEHYGQVSLTGQPELGAQGLQLSCAVGAAYEIQPCFADGLRLA